MLEKNIREKRDTVLHQEQQLQLLMPQLLSLYYANSEQPGIRFFQGRDGIIEVYKDMLRTKQTIYLIRSQHDRIFMGKGFFAKLKQERAKAGIKTEALVLDLADAHHDADADKTTLMHRTWMRPKDYTSPVEFDIYSDKVAILSFGQEAIATVIQSPQIADAMKELFKLLQVGAKSLHPS